MTLRLTPWGYARSLPPAGRRVLFGRLLALLLGNSLVGFLVVLGRVQPFDLVIFVGLEAALLSLVETVQLRFVPRQAWPEQGPRDLANRLAVPLFMALIVALNLVVIAAILDRWPLLLEMLAHPWRGLVSDRLLWPLALTLGIALVTARNDARRFRQRGPSVNEEFVSTPGLNAQARSLALVLGALPHAVPIFSWLAVAARYFERRRERLGPVEAVAAPVSRPAMVALAVYGLATLVFVSWTLSSGAAGWSVAFFGAKLASEALILCAPRPLPEPEPGGGERKTGGRRAERQRRARA